MNFLRRMFNQPETPDAPSKSSDAPSNKTTSETPPTTRVIEEGFGDNVTRPLTSETLFTTLSNNHIVYAQLSDTGMVRSNNQDATYAFFASSRSVLGIADFGVFIVADGMGGHLDGEKASAVAAQTVGSLILQQVYLPIVNSIAQIDDSPIIERVSIAVQKANSNVVQQVRESGTTLTSVTIIGDLAYIAHVGDSRIYLLTTDGIEKLTRDHSYVQRLIEMNELSDEEAEEHPNRNILYRALGQGEDIEVDTLTRRLPPRAKLVVCSDGLWNMVKDNEIAGIVNSAASPQEACSKLVAIANNRGGHDNITVIVVHVPG